MISLQIIVIGLAALGLFGLSVSAQSRHPYATHTPDEFVVAILQIALLLTAISAVPLAIFFAVLG